MVLVAFLTPCMFSVATKMAFGSLPCNYFVPFLSDNLLSWWYYLYLTIRYKSSTYNGKKCLQKNVRFRTRPLITLKTACNIEGLLITMQMMDLSRLSVPKQLIIMDVVCANFS
jgi:hypothetical protein